MITHRWISESNPGWKGVGDLHKMLIMHKPGQCFRVENQKEKDELEGYALVFGMAVVVLLPNARAPKDTWGVVRVTAL